MNSCPLSPDKRHQGRATLEETPGGPVLAGAKTFTVFLLRWRHAHSRDVARSHGRTSHRFSINHHKKLKASRTSTYSYDPLSVHRSGALWINSRSPAPSHAAPIGFPEDCVRSRHPAYMLSRFLFRFLLLSHLEDASSSVRIAGAQLRDFAEALSSTAEEPVERDDLAAHFEVALAGLGSTEGQPEVA